MTTVAEAFGKFQGRLEITQTEQEKASARQKRIRKLLDTTLDIADDFLTGAYARHTKTKPLRDVDIMIVVNDAGVVNRAPAELLATVAAVLSPEYGDSRVWPDRHAVRVDFGVAAVDDVNGQDVVSFDVIPAIAGNGHYLIPDDKLNTWVPTSPNLHMEITTAANKAFSEQWKPLVKMLKNWNQVTGKPLEPSFLVETMAVELVAGAWTGNHAYELRDFFATAAQRVDEPWADPAGTGPAVNNAMLETAGMVAAARTALRSAEQACSEAIRLERSGRTTEALVAWQQLFGPLFAKS